MKGALWVRAVVVILFFSIETEHFITFTEEIHVISFLSCNKTHFHSSLININCVKLVLCFSCRKPCRNAKYPFLFFLLKLPIPWVHQAKITLSQQASTATNLQPQSLYLCRQLSSNRQCISACRRRGAGVSSEKRPSVSLLNLWVTASAFQLLSWFYSFFFFFFFGRVGSLSYSQGFGKEPQTGIIEQLLCET